MAQHPGAPRRPAPAAPLVQCAMTPAPAHFGRTRTCGVALLLAALPALLLPPASADAQERPAEGNLATIMGRVVDAITQRPIHEVLVQLSGRGFVLETDVAGEFTLVSIPVGNYRLELSHPRYHPAVGDFTIMRSGEFEVAMEPVAADEDELMTGIVGVVSDGESGAPLRGASVRTSTGQQATVTGVRGNFALNDLAPGVHLVEFAQLGYATRTDTIAVQPGRVTNARVSLSADPVGLDPIEITVERREITLQDAGFYNRAAEGFGGFIDREEIKNRRPSEMSDVFSRLPGVELFADPDNPLEKYIVLRGGRQASFAPGPYMRCFPRVVLDGLVINRGGDEPAQLDRLLDPAAVAGVEVYPTSSGVPARYGGAGSSCGVILIWTRR